jgi:hypothetical protein
LNPYAKDITWQAEVTFPGISGQPGYIYQKEIRRVERAGSWRSKRSMIVFVAGRQKKLI